jgi:hypothetical protein
VYFFARSVPRNQIREYAIKKINGPTEADKFRPIPVAELVVHRIAPIPGSLIFRRPASLKTRPRPFRSFHITATNTGLIVEREIDPAIFLVGGQVKLGDNTGDYLVVQALCVLEWEVFEALSKLDTPLTHDVIRGDLLRFGEVKEASECYVVGVGISFSRNESDNETT